nr:hypothetical protein BAR15_140069 [Bartonella sp. AR 15-3]
MSDFFDHITSLKNGVSSYKPENKSRLVTHTLAESENTQYEPE